MKPGHRSFTPEELETVRAMGAGDVPLWRIAKHLGRSDSSVQYVLYRLRQRDRAAAGLAAPGRSVPEAVLIERDRRLAAAQSMSLTAALLGDPLPGYSALDQRGAPR